MQVDGLAAVPFCGIHREVADPYKPAQRQARVGSRLCRSCRSRRRCILIYEDLRGNFLCLEDAPLGECPRAPNPRESDVVQAFGGAGAAT